MVTTATQIVNSLWPFVGISAGMALGFVVLSMLVGAKNRETELDHWSRAIEAELSQRSGPSLNPANAVETLVEQHTPASWSLTVRAAKPGNECRYCGTDYEGKTCPQCGGPRK